MSSYKVNDQLEIHDSPDSFLSEIDRKLEKKETVEKADYTFLSLKEILATDFPKDQWIVDKLIPAKGLTCIGGLPAVMKSYISNYIALCLSQGTPLFDRHPTKKSNVLFIDKENKLARVKDRFQRLGTNNSLETIYYLASNFLIDSDRDLAAVCEFVRSHNIDVTFIDTLIRVHQKEENSASEMNRVYQAMHEIVLAGSAVTFIHHFNKMSTETTDVRYLLRGSGDILGMVDSFIALKANPPYIEVEQAKTRDEKLVPKFLIEPIFTETTTQFQFIKEIEDESKIQRIVVADEILSLLVEGAARRRTIAEHLEKFNISIRTVDRVLKDLQHRGAIVSYINGTREVWYALNKQGSLTN